MWLVHEGPVPQRNAKSWSLCLRLRKLHTPRALLVRKPSDTDMILWECSTATSSWCQGHKPYGTRLVAGKEAQVDVTISGGPAAANASFRIGAGPGHCAVAHAPRNLPIQVRVNPRVSGCMLPSNGSQNLISVCPPSPAVLVSPPNLRLFVQPAGSTCAIHTQTCSQHQHSTKAYVAPSEILPDWLHRTRGATHGTLWLAPLVDDPAAMLPSSSSATMEMVSWLFLLTLVTKSATASFTAPSA